MTAQWSREKDALIARAAEGLEVEWHRRETLHPGICIDVGQEDFCVRGGEMAWQKENWTPIFHYLTDLTACVRAAEGWLSAAPADRARRYTVQSYSICSGSRCSAKFEELGDNGVIWGMWQSSDDDVREALAWALWRACGGESDVKAT